eukprot:PhM_4_TR18079/c1_g1_i3/m.44846
MCVSSKTSFNVFNAIIVLFLTALMMASTSYAACTRPVLPTDLDIISLIERGEDSEVHIHGRYSLDSLLDPVSPHGGNEHNITITPSQDLEMRFSLQALSRAVVFVTFYEGESTVVSARNGGLYLERMFFAELSAGKTYTIHVHYALSYTDGIECHEAIMEIAMEPKAVAKPILTCREEHAAIAVPSVSPTAGNKYYYHFETTDDFWASLDGNDIDARKSTRHLQTVPLTVPHIPGHHQQWKVRVELQYNFLDGADVYAVVMPAETPYPAGTGPDLADCSSNKRCLYGYRALKNTFVLQSVITSGEGTSDGKYNLFIMQRTEGALPKRVCAPFSMSLDLFPLPQQASYLTCDVDPLPSSLHGPGLIDEVTHSLDLQRRILVNLTLRSQQATFTPV